jgi:hypothetical protein
MGFGAEIMVLGAEIMVRDGLSMSKTPENSMSSQRTKSP